MADTPAAEGSLVGSLQALLESGAGADVTLVAEGCELLAHSFILSLRSPVFAAALRHDTREARTRRIEMADVREAVLRQLLRFVYTDAVPEQGVAAADLLRVADQYDVPLLKSWCEERLARELTVESVAATAVLAQLHSCPLLLRAAADFVARNPQVMGTDGWVSAVRDHSEAAAQVCKQVAVAAAAQTCREAPPPQKRILSEERKKDLAERLLKAASNGSVGEMWALLEAGAPIDTKDGRGNTALQLAVNANRAASVGFLSGAGADVNARNSEQQTPLHRAVLCGGDIHTAWALLAASADKDAQDKNGDTALHLAARNGLKEHIKALLVAGANRDIKNKGGHTARNQCPTVQLQDLFNTY